jgi:hypothetical protein
MRKDMGNHWFGFAYRVCETWGGPDAKLLEIAEQNLGAQSKFWTALLIQN